MQLSGQKQQNLTTYCYNRDKTISDAESDQENIAKMYGNAKYLTILLRNIILNPWTFTCAADESDQGGVLVNAYPKTDLYYGNRRTLAMAPASILSVSLSMTSRPSALISALSNPGLP